jgi:hypothetical protein
MGTGQISARFSGSQRPNKIAQVPRDGPFWTVRPS